MAVKGKISELFAIPEIKSEYEEVITLIKSYNAEVEKASQIKATFKDSETPSVVIKGMQALTTSSKEYKAILETVTDRVVKLNGHSKELTQQLNIEAKTLKEVAKANLDNAKALELESKASLNNAKAKTEQQKASESLLKTQLAEIKLSDAKQRAAEKEAIASEKIAEAKRLEQQATNNEASRQQVINAKKEEELATIELAKSLQAQAAAQLELNAAIESASQSGNQRAELVTDPTALQESAEAAVVYADELESLTGTLSQNEGLMKIYKTELGQVQQELKLMDKTTSTAEKNTAKYRDKVAALTSQETRLKSEIKDLNATITQQVKINNTASGSLDSLKARYILLTREIDRLSETQRSSGIGQRLIAESSQVQIAIKKVEGETGRFQRNVGNYTNSIVTFFGNAFGFLRKAAYLIPGLGIAGIVGLLSDSIVRFFKNIVASGKSFDQSKESAKAYAEALKSVNEEAIKNGAGDIAKLQLYRDILTDTTRTEKERTQGLLAYNKVADESNKIDITQLNNLTLINEKISEQITLIEKRAFSRAAESILGKNAEALLLAKEKARATAEKQFDIESQNGLIVTAEVYDKVTGKFIKNSQAVLDLQKERIINNKIARNEEVRNAQIQFDASKKALYGLIALEGFYSDEIKKEKEKREKPDEDFSKDLAKIRADITKAEFDALKQRRQNEIDAQAAIIADEKAGYYTRLQATQAFYDRSKEMLDLQLAFEAEANKKAIEEERRQTQAKLDDKSLNLSAKQQKDLQAKLRLLKEKENAVDRSLQDKYNTDILKLNSDSEKQITGVLESETEKRKRIKEESLKAADDHAKAISDIEAQAIENEFAAAQIQLDARLEKGLISQKEYNQQTLQLQADKQIAIIQSEIKTTEALLEQQKQRLENEKELFDAQIKRAEATAALETDPNKKKDQLNAIDEAKGKFKDFETSLNDAITITEGKLTALSNKITTVIADFFKNKKEGIKNDFLSLFQGIADIAKELSGIVSGFLDAAATKEKNRLEEQIELLEKKKQKEIEVADQSITNVQDREAAISVIESRSAAQREQLERKQRQADERRARFEKIATITSIILETSLAAVRALGMKPYTPANIAQAAIVAALGAAKLAVAIATPIPKFKTGKNVSQVKTSSDKYEGPAIVDDGGKAEPIIREDGSMEIGTNKPRVTYLKKNDIVLPDESYLPKEEKKKVKKITLSEQINKFTTSITRSFLNLYTNKTIDVPKFRTGKNLQSITKNIVDHNVEHTVHHLLEGAQSTDNKDKVSMQENDKPQTINHKHLTNYFPGKEILDGIMASQQRRMEQQVREYNSNATKAPVFDTSDLHKEIKGMRKDVVNAINRKPVQQITASDKGLEAMWLYGASRVKYINDQTNWNS